MSVVVWSWTPGPYQPRLYRAANDLPNGKISMDVRKPNDRLGRFKESKPSSKWESKPVRLWVIEWSFCMNQWAPKQSHVKAAPPPRDSSIQSVSKRLKDLKVSQLQQWPNQSKGRGRQGPRRGAIHQRQWRRIQYGVVMDGPTWLLMLKKQSKTSWFWHVSFTAKTIQNHHRQPPAVHTPKTDRARRF